MREIDVNEMFGVWFHDATVSRISADYVRREAPLECTVSVGWWNSPTATGLTDGVISGTLVLTGLLYLVLEPPDERYPYEDSEGIEINSTGPVTEDMLAARLPRLPRDLPDEAFLHYFYVADWNASIFAAATGAHVRDLTAIPVTDVPPPAAQECVGNMEEAR